MTGIFVGILAGLLLLSVQPALAREPTLHFGLAEIGPDNACADFDRIAFDRYMPLKVGSRAILVSSVPGYSMKARVHTKQLSCSVMFDLRGDSHILTHSPSPLIEHLDPWPLAVAVVSPDADLNITDDGFAIIVSNRWVKYRVEWQPYKLGYRAIVSKGDVLVWQGTGASYLKRALGD